MRIVSLLVAFTVLVTFGHLVTAETTYSGYQVYVANSTIVNSSDQCIWSCLNTQDCPAVSICASDSGTQCLTSKCANLLLVSNDQCYTIVFVDVPEEDDVSLPTPLHEWIMSDTCCTNISDCNTGSQDGLSVTYSSNSARLRSGSMFLGASNIASRFNLNVYGAQINGNSNFTLLYMFKFWGTDIIYKLAEIQLPNYGTVSVVYNISIITASTVTTGSSVRNILASRTMSISSAAWHSFAFTYNTANLQVYIDNELLITAQCSFSTSQSSTSTPIISAGLDASNSMSNNATIFCLKIFDKRLAANIMRIVADSCIRGKIALAPSYLTSTEDDEITNNESPTGVIIAANYIVVRSNYTWTVPTGITRFFGLCIGGGAGGNYSRKKGSGSDGRGGGGGGSGYIAYGNVSTTPGTVFNVTIGSGGKAYNGGGSSSSSAGRSSSIGNKIFAQGGFTGSSSSLGTGGNGGSAGGGGAPLSNSSSIAGDGGSAGSNGGNATNGKAGGTGQGNSAWTQAFSFINLLGAVNITAGKPGTGNKQPPISGSWKSSGGGGGAGIILDGFELMPSSSSNNYTNGTGGTGYGAGGGGGGSTSYRSGYAFPGNNGVCVIVWNVPDA